MDEVPLTEFEDNKDGILIDAEMPGADDDSQQAAEAMVQLGTLGYYHQNEGETNEALLYKGDYKRCTGRYFYLRLNVTEESLDVDPNYDPSDFLMAGLPKNRVFEDDIKVGNTDIGLKIQDDLAVSESEDEGPHAKNAQQIQDDDDVGDVWF